MTGYLYIADEDGSEIEGSRRYVDYATDRERYFRVKAQLERAAGEGCTVKDSEVDG